MEAYYYRQMNKEQRQAYDAMRAGLVKLEDMFLVPGLEPRELSDVFFKMRLDHPEIFYAVTFKYRSYPQSANYQMIPVYLFDKKKIKEHQQAMQARVAKVAAQMKGMPKWDQEKFIHDFLCQQVHYDKLKKPYSHEIIGPLGHGVGVCEGIAKSAKILCDAVGIWCVIAISEANPEKQLKYRHAWNIIKLDNQYYHLDVTFDNTISHGDIRYDYFNLDDSHIFRDHEPVIVRMPACQDGGRFYYKEKKISFTKIEEVEKRAKQAVKKKKPFIFHWRGGYLTKEVMAQLVEMLQRCAREKEQYARIYLNWAQAVVAVAFEQSVMEAEIVMEDVNENERE